MSLEQFKRGFYEYYQGEVAGEVFFSGVLKRFDNPEHRYKIASLLQLETETKARLRPAALELGIDLVESDDFRQQGYDFLKACEGMDWNAWLLFFLEAVGPFVVKYRDIAKLAPPEYKEVADSMVVHEAALETWAKREIAGDTENSLDDVIKQLKFPLPRKY